MILTIVFELDGGYELERLLWMIEPGLESTDLIKYLAAAGVLLILAAFIVWFIPKWQAKSLARKPLAENESEFSREKDLLEFESDARKTIVQLVGGIFLITGLF